MVSVALPVLVWLHAMSSLLVKVLCLEVTPRRAKSCLQRAGESVTDPGVCVWGVGCVCLGSRVSVSGGG